jgi:hypothetical protein
MVTVFCSGVDRTQKLKMMWKELQWKQTCDTAGKLLKAEKSLFTQK